jgi:lipopolysaccharide transport system ATP-binding protein
MKPIIRVDNLWKRYRIGTTDAAYVTFRETLTSAALVSARGIRARLRGESVRPVPGPEPFWALKGVDFQIGPGEVVGLIGCNGAGKSTLLKVLSRVTEPTRGSVSLYGRVGGLLEVGTGFHAELTGRENVYLNGAILGMKRREIDRKFDEIVAFAGVEQFLETPVKRYSNGMFVRLAFAVASHLDPEVLIIDEVLSVGDAAYQKKCLNRIRAVAQTGKTVLLVTHHLQLCTDVCTRAIHLRDGAIIADGDVDHVVSDYLVELRGDQHECRVLTGAQRRGATIGDAQFVDCRLTSARKEGPWVLPFNEPIDLAISVAVRRPFAELELSVALSTAGGLEFASCLAIDALGVPPIDPARHEYRVRLPNLKLAPGSYSLGFGLRSAKGTEDDIPTAVHFDVTPTPESAVALVYRRRGPVVPDLEWCRIEV